MKDYNGERVFQLDEIYKNGEYHAIGDNGTLYRASYSEEFHCMFFAIPSTVHVIGYIPLNIQSDSEKQ